MQGTTNSANVSSLKAMILDMDGVLWRGDRPLSNLVSLFASIHRCGLRFILATNNATLSVDQYIKKLSQFGVALEKWQVVNSSLATARFLKERHPKGGKVYIIGEEGLIHTLQDSGFYHSEKNVLAVVVGLDRALTYTKLSVATLLIHAGAQFVGTNPDRTFPQSNGLVPGAGAILAALESATGIKPTIIGKPSPEMYRIALDRLGTTPEETLVVGDRLETDIAGAQDIGCRTALVLSGVTTLKQAKDWKPSPDYIAQDLKTLIDQL